MPYLGNDLQVAQPSYRNIDDISSSFNSVTTSFALLVGGFAPVPFPINSNQCLISVAGVVQRPDDSGAEGFRLSGGNIIFSSAPTTGSDFFGVILAGADYVNVGANFPSGSAAVPSITFDSDLDTGIYNSAPNQVSITTSGTERLRVDSSGQIESVSLGSASSPAYSWTADPNTGIYSPGADQVAVATNGTGRLFVDSSGNVKVGSTDNSNAGTQYITVGAPGATVGGLQLWATTTGSSFVQFGDGTASADNYRGYMAYLHANDALTFGTASTERLRITSAGLVGVGTSAPSNLLEVSSATTAYIRSSSTTNSISGVFGANTSSFDVGTTSSHAMNFYTAGVNRATLDTSGRLGVGTTTPTDAQLYVNSSEIYGVRINHATLPLQSFLVNGTQAFSIGANSGGGGSFYYGTGNVTAATIDSSGRLLVGTSTSLTGTSNSQYARLQVVGNTAGTPRGGLIALGRDAAASAMSSGDFLGGLVFTDNGSAEFAHIFCYTDAASGANDYPSRLVFSTTADGASSPTERLRITSAGFVGIGTSSPSSPLHLSTGSAAASALFASTDSTAYSATSFLSSARLRITGGSATNAYNGITFGNNSNAEGFIGFVQNASGYGDFVVQSYAGSYAEKLRVTSAGNVGIGSTPNRTLHVFGETALSNSANTGTLLIIPGAGGNYIYSRAADGAATAVPFILNVGTQEALRVDTSGRLLVGASTATTTETVKIKQLSNTRYYGLWIENSANDSGLAIGYDTTSDCFAFSPSYGSTGSYKGLAFFTSNVENARIDTSGRLLVGTSSTSNSLVTCLLQGNAASSTSYAGLTLARGVATPADGDYLGEIDFSDNTHTASAIIRAQRDGGTWSGSSKPTRLVFSTTADGAPSPTERMRIANNGVIQARNAAGDTLNLYNAVSAGSSNAFIYGLHSSASVYAGTTSFIVYTNGNVVNTNGSYTTISDAKLKENIVDAGSQWSDLKAIQIRNWNFKAETGHETHRQIGPIAQELETVCPGLVFETPDRDPEGNDLGTTTKGVNQSVLYMKAVKALQEAMERIEQLETSNADLLARVTALEGA